MANEKRYKMGKVLRGIAKAMAANKNDPDKLQAMADQLTTVSESDVNSQGIALSESALNDMAEYGIALSE